MYCKDDDRERLLNCYTKDPGVPHIYDVDSIRDLLGYKSNQSAKHWIETYIPNYWVGYWRHPNQKRRHMTVYDLGLIEGLRLWITSCPDPKDQAEREKHLEQDEELNHVYHAYYAA